MMSERERKVQRSKAAGDGEAEDVLEIAELHTDAVFCTQCGTANRPNAHYCRNCGRVIDDDASLDHLQMPPSQKTKRDLAEPVTSTRRGHRPITGAAVAMEIMTTAIMAVLFLLVMPQNGWLALAVLVAWMATVLARWTSD